MNGAVRCRKRADITLEWVLVRTSGAVRIDHRQHAIEFQRDGQAQSRDWEAKREVKKEAAK